jgi:hypothetical protein
MHNVFRMIFEGRLIFAPIDRPRYVLMEQLPLFVAAQPDDHLSNRCTVHNIAQWRTEANIYLKTNLRSWPWHGILGS